MAQVPGKPIILLALLLLSGCSLLQVADTSEKAEAAAAAISEAVPSPVGLYFKLASCILGAVSIVAFGLHKWRNAIHLKKPI